MAEADFNPRNPEQVFPGNAALSELGKAILDEDTGRIRALVGQNPPLLNAAGFEGISPLMFATLNQRPKAVDVLVRLGADPYQLTSESINLGDPIGFALRATNGPDILAVMLGAGATIEGGKEDDNEPLLYTAILLPGDARLKELIAAGANLNVSNSVGDTPLMVAMNSMQIAKVEMLLQAGANPFLGRWNLLVDLLENDDWEPGTPNDLTRKRLIDKLRAMGMTEKTQMKPAPTRDQLRQMKP